MTYRVKGRQRQRNISDGPYDGPVISAGRMFCTAPFPRRCLPLQTVALLLFIVDGNLQRQLERYAEERGYDVVQVFSEQASGVGENLKQLASLLKLAEDGAIARVLIEYPDRLARFGYRYRIPAGAGGGSVDDHHRVFSPDVRQAVAGVPEKDRAGHERDGG
ncbi:protein of unknown function [Kyrpidia spormannii]|uniref:Uncharacterized protein n=1 Tax=Kyrpidia spormannii TaxID=2055160 RepID=A0ACA8Z5Y7_9BACL|nr:protein of unknown function [Kyrpidia spormannii]